MSTATAPVRMSLTDMQSQETVTVMFNPTELHRRLAASYARKKVLGSSHEPHEYTGTENQGLRFDLFYIAESELDLARCENTLNFLESLLYSTVGADSYDLAAPPDVLVVWPRTLSLVCRLMSLEVVHQRFNRHGNTIQFTASTTWEEARIRRLNKADVRSAGSLRAPVGDR